uniref:phosphatidylinositol-3,5-bisphosphate 3-phosphatase n=1 Tax=Acrobeloides nanus TaxID=290746 RepID=A0A914BX16_9BILA
MKEQQLGYLSPDGKIFGRVYITNFRLRFESTEQASNKNSDFHFDVTLGSISKVEKVGYAIVGRGEDTYGLNITCKDLRSIRFPFFATVYKENFSKDGWDLYDPYKEFNRMKLPNALWEISNLNRPYDFAPTYPAVLGIPKAAFDEKDFLKRVSEFRSKQRIPVLSWYNPETAAAIVRSAQPMAGIKSKKSPDDERYLRMIIDANPQNSHSQILPIYDARPVVNAQVNRVTSGGGYEEDYQYCKLEFLDIQNIHVVRDSLRKLKEACSMIDHKNFKKNRDDTKWLAHIQTILDGAWRIALDVQHKNLSVLVHCSDGWDRTAQLTSLAMLMLDPYYRTIEGFAVLIEKEWCSFGHKFAHRIGHGEDKHGDGERSPIFVQFIDCVWQLFNEFTSNFEFNVRFLKTILDELYACRFGTFLYNNEKERNDLKVKRNTVSLWSYVFQHRSHFINSKYDHIENFQRCEMLKNNKVQLCNKLWTEYYCRYNVKVISPESIEPNDNNIDSENNGYGLLSLSNWSNLWYSLGFY